MCPLARCVSDPIPGVPSGLQAPVQAANPNPHIGSSGSVSTVVAVEEETDRVARDDFSWGSVIGILKSLGIEDFGYFHRRVQQHFVAAHPGARMEVPVPGGGLNGGVGRIDLELSGFIWEVKPVTAMFMGLADNQLNRYQLADPGYRRGPSESFTVPPDANGWGIQVVSPRRGELYYWPVVMPLPLPDPVPVDVPVPVVVPGLSPERAPAWKRPLEVVGGLVVVAAGVVVIAALTADDVTGLGVLDDPLLVPAGGLVAGGLQMVGG